MIYFVNKVTVFNYKNQWVFEREIGRSLVEHLTEAFYHFSKELGDLRLVFLELSWEKKRVPFCQSLDFEEVGKPLILYFIYMFRKINLNNG